MSPGWRLGASPQPSAPATTSGSGSLEQTDRGARARRGSCAARPCRRTGRTDPADRGPCAPVARSRRPPVGRRNAERDDPQSFRSRCRRGRSRRPWLRCCTARARSRSRIRRRLRVNTRTPCLVKCSGSVHEREVVDRHHQRRRGGARDDRRGVRDVDGPGRATPPSANPRAARSRTATARPGAGAPPGRPGARATAEDRDGARPRRPARRRLPSSPARASRRRRAARRLRCRPAPDASTARGCRPHAWPTIMAGAAARPHDASRRRRSVEQKSCTPDDGEQQGLRDDASDVAAVRPAGPHASPRAALRRRRPRDRAGAARRARCARSSVHAVPARLDGRRLAAAGAQHDAVVLAQQGRDDARGVAPRAVARGHSIARLRAGRNGSHPAAWRSRRHPQVHDDRAEHKASRLQRSDITIDGLEPCLPLLGVG